MDLLFLLEKVTPAGIFIFVSLKKEIFELTLAQLVKLLYNVPHAKLRPPHACTSSRKLYMTLSVS